MKRPSIAITLFVITFLLACSGASTRPDPRDSTGFGVEPDGATIVRDGGNDG